MKIQFKELGRNKVNPSIAIKEGLSADSIAEIAYQEAKKHLASRYPDTTYDSAKNEGIVFAGFHVVGTFSVVN